MFGGVKGSDAFEDVINDSTKLQNTMKGLSPPAAKALNVGLVPAAATLLSAAVPGGAAVRLGVAAVGAVAASKARKRLMTARKESVNVALCELLASRGIEGVSAASVMEIGDRYGLSSEELATSTTFLFAKYFERLVESPVATTAELSELISLAEALGLDGPTSGDAVYQTAVEVYAVRCGRFTGDAEENAFDAEIVDKFLWLAGRFFAEHDTEEAATYELSRITKIFDISEAELERRCLKVATPFYESAVEKAIGKLGSVRHSALEKASKRVGLPPYITSNLHADRYRLEVQRLLENGDNRLSPEDQERLDLLAELLAVPETIVDEQRAAVTRPLFRETLDDALQALGDGQDASAIAASVAKRMAELQVPPGAADRAIADAVIIGLSPFYAEAVQMNRVRNKGGTVKALRELLQRRRKFAAFLNTLRSSYGGDRLQNSLDRAFRASGEQARKDTVEMYAMFVQKATGDSAVLASPEQIAEFEELAKALGLAEDVARSLRQSDSLPKLEAALDACFLNSTFTIEQRDANLAFSASLGVPLSVYVGLAKDRYLAELRAASGAGRVFTGAERQRLNDVRVFLDLTEEEVAPMHKEVSGATYRKALLESFGVTGQISEELEASLKTLRERLLLSEEQADEISMEAARERQRPRVDALVMEFKKEATPQAQGGGAMGGDGGEDVYAQPGNKLGIGGANSFMIEALTLVEFFNENGIVGEREGAAQSELQSQLEEAAGITPKSEEAKDDSAAYALRFAINATGMADEKVLKDAYKHFVVSAFQEQRPAQKQRMEAATPALAGILGLSTEDVRKVHTTIGTAVYGQYLGMSLAKKNKLDQQDFAFLGSMRTQLGLPQEDADSLLQKAKVRRVKNEAESIMLKGNLKPEKVKELRDLAGSLSVDLVRDLDMSDERRLELFSAEASGLIEDVYSDVSMIEELAEELYLSDEQAEEALRGLLVDRCRAAAGNALADAHVGRAQRAIAEADRLLRLARFAPEVVELMPSEETSEKLLRMYENAGPAGTGLEAEAKAAEAAAKLVEREAERAKITQSEGVSHGAGSDMEAAAMAAKVKAATLRAAADVAKQLDEDRQVSFLPKPFTVKTLAERVKKELGVRKDKASQEAA